MSQAVWRHGVVEHAELDAAHARRARTRGGRSCRCRCRAASRRRRLRGARREQLALDAPARRADRRAQPEPRAAADLVERERVAQPLARDDPRAGRARRGGPASRCRCAPRRRWRRARPSHGGSSASSRGASAASTPRPEALSSAPGDGGTVSACAITHAQAAALPAQHADHVARAPARRREPLHPHVAGPRVSKRRAIRSCARRSGAPAAGRGAVARRATPRSCAPRAPGAAAARRDERREHSERAAPAEHGRHGLEQDRQVERRPTSARGRGSRAARGRRSRAPSAPRPATGR